MGQSIIKNIKKIFSQSSNSSGGGGSSIWGTITGFLSNQTDLQDALDAKADQSQVDALQGDVDTLIIDVTNLEGSVNTLELNNTGINTGDETKTSIINKLDLISGTVNIDFGKDGVLSENDLVITTVLNTDVLATTKFQCIVENDGTDHTGEDVYLENIIASVYNIIPNTSFDIIAVAHNLTWGRYKITYKEII
jgi:hypothetical protein